MSRIALDSNILAYFVDHRVAPDDGAKVTRVRDIIDRLSDRAAIIAPVQTLGELNVVLRRAGMLAKAARLRVEALANAFDTPASMPSTLHSAMAVVERHQLQFWDSMIIAASLESGCSLLLSEDMQDGFAIRGLTIVNPLTEKPHRALAKLLEA